MKKKRIKSLCMALLLALTFIVPQTGCKAKEPVSASDFLLNTMCSISLYDGSDSKLIQETFAVCKDYEKQLSRTIESSDIGKINDGEGQWIQVHETTAELIQKAILYGSLSNGLFDVSVGELSELWNFTGDNPTVPDKTALADAVKHVDYKNIEIKEEPGEKAGQTNCYVRLSDPRSKIDLGGIAKGYIADKAAEYLREQGVAIALLNFGGNVVCLGEKEDQSPWKVGVEKPFSSDDAGNKEILGIVEVKPDQSVVTSGIYERQFEQDGKRYHHVLDPNTGYPRDTDLAGVTIVGDMSVDCDALSTTCLMLGKDKAKELIDSLDHVEAVFVEKDNTVTMTDGIKWTEKK